MPLFEISDKGKLSYIKDDDFKLEKDIQRLTEENLKLIFDVSIVRSEFIINNKTFQRFIKHP